MSHMPIPNEDKTKALVKKLRKMRAASNASSPGAHDESFETQEYLIELSLHDEELINALEAHSSSATMRAALVEAREKHDEINKNLGEAIHAAFRKASDHEAASRAYRAIRELPLNHWQAIVGFIIFGFRIPETLTRIDAALNAGGEGDGWQPIESAPDGEVVLVCNTEYGDVPCLAVYSRTANHWRSHATLGILAGDYAPTHWRPLPSPPTNAHGTGD